MHQGRERWRIRVFLSLVSARQEEPMSGLRRSREVNTMTVTRRMALRKRMILPSLLKLAKK